MMGVMGVVGKLGFDAYVDDSSSVVGKNMGDKTCGV